MDYFDPVTHSDTRNNLLRYKRNFITCPDQWQTLGNDYESLRWSEVKFNSVSQGLLPETEGLYMFLASPKKINADFVNYLFYIGETDNLRRRFGDYLNKVNSPKTGQYKVHLLINDFPEHLYFRFVEFTGMGQVERREVESKFLTAFMPPVNTKYPQYLQSIVQGVYGQ